MYGSGVETETGYSKWHFESVGIRTWMNATFTLNVELLDLFQVAPTFTLTIFDITPYRQIIRYYRPEYTLMETVFDSSNSVADFWDMEIGATFDLDFLSLSSVVTDNAKTLKYSFMDLFLNPSTATPYPTSMTQLKADLSYDSDYEVTYTDKYYSIDILKLLGLDLTTWKYYGADKWWYRFSILHEDTNDQTDQVLWDVINWLS